MKHFFSTITFLCIFFGYAQKPCDFSTNVVDSLGSYKTTKEYLLYEKNFAGNSTYLFASFILADEKPLLNLQLIEKSADFIKIKCFDKSSKVYVQLANNKIVTLSFVNEESCGTLVRDDKGLNNRILTGYFSISKTDYADLKKSTISFIRIKFSTDLSDYIFKKEFKSELNSDVYEPESYFINFLHCLETKS